MQKGGPDIFDLPERALKKLLTFFFKNPLFFPGSNLNLHDFLCYGG